MRSYEVARSSFSFVEGAAQFTKIFGAIAAIGGGVLAFQLTGGGELSVFAAALGALPGILMVIAGFYGQAMAQIGRASVDSAEYGQQSLQVARDQLELSRQALVQSQQMSMSYAMVAKKPVSAEGETPDTSQDVSAGPSYADRVSEPTAKVPEQQVETLDGPSAMQLEAQSAPLAIAQQTFVTLPDVSDKIVCKNGRYYAEGKKFWSRSEAEDYVRSEMARA